MTEAERKKGKRLLTRLITATDRYMRVRERLSAKAERNGMIGQSDVKKEDQAQDAYLKAQAALVEWFDRC